MGRTTTAITLVLVGACIAACDNNERHRAIYTSKEACLKDWNSESECQQSQTAGGGYVFHGPWYTRSSAFWGRSGAAYSGIEAEGRGSVSSASESAHFGGFGESAGAHGGAGE